MERTLKASFVISKQSFLEGLFGDLIHKYSFLKKFSDDYTEYDCLYLLESGENISNFNKEKLKEFSFNFKDSRDIHEILFDISELIRNNLNKKYTEEHPLDLDILTDNIKIPVLYREDIFNFLNSHSWKESFKNNYSK